MLARSGAIPNGPKRLNRLVAAEFLGGALRAAERRSNFPDGRAAQVWSARYTFIVPAPLGWAVLAA